MYCFVAVFVGVSPVYSGVSPYATCSVLIVFPSPSTHVIVYDFGDSVNWAIYVTFPVTSGRFSLSYTVSFSDDFHPVNVYVYCAVAVLVGVSPA